MIAHPDWELVYEVSVGKLDWIDLTDQQLARIAVCSVDEAVHQTAIDNILEARAWLALKYVELIPEELNHESRG